MTKVLTPKAARDAAREFPSKPERVQGQREEEEAPAAAEIRQDSRAGSAANSASDGPAGSSATSAAAASWQELQEVMAAEGGAARGSHSSPLLDEAHLDQEGRVPEGSSSKADADRAVHAAAHGHAAPGSVLARAAADAEAAEAVAAAAGAAGAGGSEEGRQQQDFEDLVNPQ